MQSQNVQAIDTTKSAQMKVNSVQTIANAKGYTFSAKIMKIEINKLNKHFTKPLNTCNEKEHG